MKIQRLIIALIIFAAIAMGHVILTSPIPVEVELPEEEKTVEEIIEGENRTADREERVRQLVYVRGAEESALLFSVAHALPGPMAEEIDAVKLALRKTSEAFPPAGPINDSIHNLKDKVYALVRTSNRDSRKNVSDVIAEHLVYLVEENAPSAERDELEFIVSVLHSMEERDVPPTGDELVEFIEEIFNQKIWFTPQPRKEGER